MKNVAIQAHARGSNFVHFEKRPKKVRNSSLFPPGSDWSSAPHMYNLSTSQRFSFKAGPPLDLSFWSFLTFLHHGIEDVERHLL